MRIVVGLLVAAFLLVESGFAETVYDNRNQYQTIGAYQRALNQVRAKLYSDDDDVREDALELLIDSGEQPIQDGDTIFPLTVLADLVMGIGAPDGIEIDDDLQEEALEFIIDAAIEEDHSIGRREIALNQLIRIASVEQLADFGWSEEAVGTLIDLVDSDNFILVHGALVGLGRVVNQSLSDWEDLAASAAEAIGERMGDSDTEIRRIALNQGIKSLYQAEEATDAIETLWDILGDVIGEIESPALQKEMRARTSALIKKQQGSIFQDEVDEVREELRDLKTERRLASESLEESLEELQDEEDLEDIEAYLSKVEREVTGKHAKLLGAASALAEIAANPEISQYKLRYVTDSMVILAFKAQSALVYYRTASAMAELVALHRTSIMATVPMAQLGRLMAATDQMSLIVPVVNEMRDLALSQMPHWIRRRLVALIFMQAGDALQAGTRQHAFEQLSTLGRASSTSWGVRMEVLTRMNQLAQYTKYADTKASAAKWK